MASRVGSRQSRAARATVDLDGRAGDLWRSLYGGRALSYAVRRPGGDWARAKLGRSGRDLLVHQKVLDGHIDGRLWLAPVAPADLRADWLALDLDCHDGDRERLGRTWASVRAALDLDSRRSSVVLVQSSLSGGLHCFVRLARAYPVAEIRARIAERLTRAGVELAPGSVEIYPHPGRALRLPCGSGSLLADWETLRPYEPLTVRAWCDDWQGAAQGAPTLAALAGDRRSVGHRPSTSAGPVELAERGHQERRGPGCAGERQPIPRSRCRSRVATPKGAESQPVSSLHNNLKILSLSPPVSGLVYGDDWHETIGRYLAQGAPIGERHNAALKVAWYHLAICGLSREQAFTATLEWARLRLPQDDLDARAREIRHYLWRHLAELEIGPRSAPRAEHQRRRALPLSESDRDRLLAKVRPEVHQEAAAILAWLQSRADDTGCVRGEIELAGRFLAAICGGSRYVRAPGQHGRARAHQLALADLARAGMLCRVREYRVGQRGRSYRCLVQFQADHEACAVELEHQERQVNAAELGHVLAQGREPARAPTVPAPSSGPGEHQRPSVPHSPICPSDRAQEPAPRPRSAPAPGHAVELAQATTFQKFQLQDLAGPSTRSTPAPRPSSSSTRSAAAQLGHVERRRAPAPGRRICPDLDLGLAAAIASAVRAWERAQSAPPGSPATGPPF